jgi:hypothetical protein
VGSACILFAGFYENWIIYLDWPCPADMNKNLKRLCILVLLSSCIPLVTACREESDESPADHADAPASDVPKGPPNYGGAVDTVNCDVIGGWIWNASSPSEVIKVDIYGDGKIVGSVPAVNSRPDLKNLGGTGDYGFRISTPVALKDGQPHVIGAKVSGGSYDIKVWEKVQSSLVCKPG